MAALALGGLGAAFSVHVMSTHLLAGIAGAVLSFTLIGAGSAQTSARTIRNGGFAASAFAGIAWPRSTPRI